MKAINHYSSAFLSILFLNARTGTWAQSFDKEPAQGWGGIEVQCPTRTTTWVHPDDNDTMETTLHCIDDPSNLFGGERCYYMFVPTCAAVDAPLVMVFHGRSGCPAEVDEALRWGKLAKEKCFVVVYPWGNIDFNKVSTSCWQQNGGLSLPGLFQKSAGTCCCGTLVFGLLIPVLEASLKDDEFVRNVVQDAVTKSSVAINTKRIYVAGHSNGSTYGLGFALQNSDLIAAVGIHSGHLTEQPPRGNKYNPVPVWMVHGLLDQDLPYAPYDSTDLGFFSTLGKDKEVEFLGNLHGCDEAVVRDDTTWGADAYLITRTNCNNNADVSLLTVPKAGHFAMLGLSKGERKEDIPEVEETMIDTTRLAWEFISKYEKSNEPDLTKNAKSAIFPANPILLALGGASGLVLAFNGVVAAVGSLFSGFG